MSPKQLTETELRDIYLHAWRDRDRAHRRMRWAALEIRALVEASDRAKREREFAG
jgi:hypothetical protein